VGIVTAYVSYPGVASWTGAGLTSTVVPTTSVPGGQPDKGLIREGGRGIVTAYASYLGVVS
jgi:hypothetical protein